MSIELENPKTVLEKIEAASNFVEQMFLAHRIGDDATFKEGHKRAGDLLFDAARQLEDEEESDPATKEGP